MTASPKPAAARRPVLNWRNALFALAGLALVAYPLLRPGDQYHQTVLILIFVLGVMATGWNVIAGFTGYVSLGQSAFLGIGAYTVGLLTKVVHVSPFVLAPLGGIVAAVVAALLGSTIMRTREHAYVIITIAFLFLMQAIGLNAPGLTGGSDGITLPLPSWGLNVGNMPFYYALFGLMLASTAMTWWIRRTKFGMGLIAIREDEDKAAAIGVRTSVYKILATVASGVLIGVAGGVYAYFLTFIDPRGMFAILVSVQIVLATLLGGLGTIWGPVLGAFLVVPMNEVTNNVMAAQGVHLFVFGLVLMAVVMFLPRGLIPTVKGWIDSRRKDAVAFERRQSVAKVVELSAPPVRTRSGPEAGAASGGRPLLAVDGLVKRFGGITAVDGCSFAVAEGSLTGLIGPNGSGKTTVFNLISGMMRANEGAIRLDGERIDGLQPWDRAYRGLGRTFQSTRLFPKLTVMENVVAPLKSFQWNLLPADAVSGREAKRALDFVGLADFGPQPAWQLSFGQKKLVELAQLLMLEPRLILLDEPAGGINPGLIERISDTIRALNKQGLTFVIVEHNMPMVLDLCDSMLVMARGSVIAEGSPDEIQANPLVLDAYLGEDWNQEAELEEARS
jgi:branched-chain amino acid transport system permease protein